MFAKRIYRKFLDNHFSLSHHYKPWSGCGFNYKIVDVDFVKCSDGSINVEIEIGVLKGKKNRSYSEVGSMKIDSETSEQLLKFLGE